MTFKYPPESKPLDGYTIKRAIQRGGFGEVYFALSDAGKEVALKLLQSNFDIELRGIAQCLNLKHPNLLTIFDVRQNAVGEHWVVMEYMGGQTLDEIIAAHPDGLPTARVEQYLAGIAAGVSYLHEQGLVHRDLKPANIYVEHGHVKIGDVGLSKFISTSRRSGHTESVGTVYYMAPEIAHGRYGHEIDVYALGVILFEMLTGRVPFDGETTGEILMKQLTQAPDLSPLPANLRPVLQRALEKDPNQRTHSADQLLLEYREPSASMSAVSKPVAPATDRHDEIPLAELSPNQPQRVPVTVLVAPSEAFERESRKPQHPQFVMQQKEAPFVHPAECFEADGVTQATESEVSLKHWLMMRPMLLVCVLAGLWFSLIVVISASTKTPLPPRFVVLSIAAGCLFWSFVIVRIITIGVRRAFLLPPLDAEARDRQQAERIERAQRLNEEYHRYRAPEERRLLALDRLAEMTGAMSVAALSSCVLAVALWAFEAFLKTPAQAAFFAVGVTLGCWAAIIPAKLYEGRGSSGIGRRVLSGLLGILAGVGIFTLDDYLKIRLDMANFEQIAVAWSPSLNFSTRAAMALQGYALFFGLLLVVRRWWYRIEALRPVRLSIWSLLGTTGTAFLIALFMRVPLEWGLMWGLSMSLVAQISSHWIPTPHRQ